MPGDPYFAPPPKRLYVEEPGADPGKLRIGMTTRSLFGHKTDPECVEATKNAAKLLEELGHHVEEVKLDIDRDRLVRAYLTQVGVGVAAEIDQMAGWTGKCPKPEMFEPGTWFLRQVGLTLSALQLQEARDAVQDAGRAMARFHERFDLFLGPTLAHPPVRIGQLAIKPAERVGLAALRKIPVRAGIQKVLGMLAKNNFERTPNTQLFNQTGQPRHLLAASLESRRASHWDPAGSSDGRRRRAIADCGAARGGPAVGGAQAGGLRVED